MKPPHFIKIQLKIVSSLKTSGNALTAAVFYCLIVEIGYVKFAAKMVFKISVSDVNVRHDKRKRRDNPVINKNSPEAILRQILELDPIEFLGICRIIGVNIYKEIEEAGVEENVEGAPASEKPKQEPRDFVDIWSDVCDTIDAMNRTRRRNLNKLVRAATKK